MSVTVVSCIYGDRYDGFVAEWAAAIAALDPAPDAVTVLSDRPREIPGADVKVALCGWKHPQAFYLRRAIRTADTTWAWVVDIDDLALPDGLNGLSEVTEDVWQMGYRRNGLDFAPVQMDGRYYLGLTGNPFTAGSAIRTEAFRRVGGFTDVAFQDWALWRRLARAGATFRASGRAHYIYRRHEGTRSVLELTPRKRRQHEEEMVAVERA